MLLLTRTPGKSVCLGEAITVTILSVNGNQLRIGIDAPASVSIFREELLKNTQPPAQA